MSFETFRTFFALLSLAAATGTVLLAVAMAAPRSRLAANTNGIVAGTELRLALAVALTSSLGSLYLSEIAHLEPCRLCWYQRIAMYPLALILGIAVWKRDDTVRRYAMPLASAGLLISGYHYLLQRFPGLDTGACSAGVPCSAAYFWEFGFISIPFMAFTGFAAVIALLAVQSRRTLRDPTELTRERSPR